MQQQFNQIRRFFSNPQTPDSAIAHRIPETPPVNFELTSFNFQDDGVLKGWGKAWDDDPTSTTSVRDWIYHYKKKLLWEVEQSPSVAQIALLGISASSLGSLPVWINLYERNFPDKVGPSLSTPISGSGVAQASSHKSRESLNMRWSQGIGQ